jgi:hypothetical protein
LFRAFGMGEVQRLYEPLAARGSSQIFCQNM